MRRTWISAAALLAMIILAGCGVENLDGVALATPSFAATPTPQIALAAAESEPPEIAPVYDAFDYDSGAFSGGSGGIGWASGWYVSGDAVTIASTGAAPLAYRGSGITVEGGERALLLSGDSEELLRRDLRIVQFEDVYVSFLFQFPEDNAELSQNEFAVLWFESFSGPNLGLKANEGPGGQDFFARATGVGSEAWAGDLQPGETYFIVGRLAKESLDGGYRVDLWINPDFDDLDTPDATSSTTSILDSLETVGIRTANVGQDTMLLDELRLGSAWEEVVPLTEAALAELAAAQAAPTAEQAPTSEPPAASAPGELAAGPLDKLMEKDFLGTTLSMNYPANWQEAVSGQFTNVFDPSPDLPAPPGVFVFIQLSSRFGLDESAETVAAEALSAHINWLVDGSFAPEAARFEPAAGHQFQWGGNNAAAFAWQDRSSDVLSLAVAVMDTDNERFVVFTTGTLAAQWPDYSPIAQDILSTVTLDGQALGDAVRAAADAVLGPLVEVPTSGDTSAGAADAPAAEATASEETSDSAEGQALELANTFNKTFINETITMNYPAGWEAEEGGQSLSLYDPENFDPDSFTGGVGVRFFIQASGQYNVDTTQETVAPEIASALLQFFGQRGVAPGDIYPFTWGGLDAAAYYAYDEANNAAGILLVLMSENRRYNINFNSLGSIETWEANEATYRAIIASLSYNGDKLPAEEVQAAIDAAIAESQARRGEE